MNMKKLPFGIQTFKDIIVFVFLGRDDIEMQVFS